MFFSAIFPLALLVASVAADTHDSCTCINGDSYNSRLTSAACASYNAAGWKWGGSNYDSGSGRCAGTDGGRLAGDQWEEACQTVAQHNGFPCPDGKGTCYASVDTVVGSC